MRGIGSYLMFTIGLLLLAAGLLLHNFVHGANTDFARGFFIGFSLVFMVAGLIGKARRKAG